MSDLDLRNVESHEDRQAILDFSAFLQDTSSRCAVCLSDDLAGSSRKFDTTSHKHYRVCMACRDRWSA